MTRLVLLYDPFDSRGPWKASTHEAITLDHHDIATDLEKVLIASNMLYSPLQMIVNNIGRTIKALDLQCHYD
jgi:hypothetical protein